MLPRWHFLWGLIFAVIFKILVPQTDYVYLFLIWFASVFIDFDHFLTAGIQTQRWSLRHALRHNYEERQKAITLKRERGVCEKGNLHIFHTVECHLIVGLLGIAFAPIFFIFIGMVFHSILDIIWMVRHDLIESREFFLFNKIRSVFF